MIDPIPIPRPQRRSTIKGRAGGGGNLATFQAERRCWRGEDAVGQRNFTLSMS